MLADRALAIAAGSFALVATTTAGVFAWQLHSTKVDLEICRTKVTQLTTSIERQNSAITELKSAGDLARARAASAVEAARVGAQANQKQSDALRSLSIAGKATDCDSAWDEIEKGAKR